MEDAPDVDVNSTNQKNTEGTSPFGTFLFAGCFLSVIFPIVGIFVLTLPLGLLMVFIDPNGEQDMVERFWPTIAIGACVLAWGVAAYVAFSSDESHSE